MCWGPNGPWQIIAMQPLIKIFKCFFNYKLNVQTGFLDPESMGKDTKSDFLSQIVSSRSLVGLVATKSHACYLLGGTGWDWV